MSYRTRPLFLAGLSLLLVLALVIPSVGDAQVPGSNAASAAPTVAACPSTVGGQPIPTNYQPFSVPLPIMQNVTASTQAPPKGYIGNASGTAPKGPTSITVNRCVDSGGTVHYAYGYNGVISSPGPTLRVGAPIQTTYVMFTNGILSTALAPDEFPLLTTHLHGGRTPPEHDGHPNDFFPSGQLMGQNSPLKDWRVYKYPNIQEPTTLWYHDHADAWTDDHVAKGLFGFYIIQDDPKIAQYLPTYSADPDKTYEVPLALQLSPVDGTTILANGATQPFFAVEPRNYRFRLLNPSEFASFQLVLQPVDKGLAAPTMTQIGSDGGLLPQPRKREVLRMSPAERYDMVIDFSGYTPSTTSPPQINLVATRDDGSTTVVMQFQVSKALNGKDNTDLSKVGNATWSDLSGGNWQLSPTKSFSFTATEDFSTFMITDNMNNPDDPRAYDKFYINAVVAQDDLQVWELVNPMTTDEHPIHIHAIFFQVIAESTETDPNTGRVIWRPVDPADRGWKDVFVLPPARSPGNPSRLRIIGKFRDNHGIYVFHCHNLIHEDLGMMGQFLITPKPGGRSAHSHHH